MTPEGGAAAGAPARGGGARIWRANLLPRRRVPDLSGMTVGTWQVINEVRGEEKPQCMCRCVRCGVRKIIPAFKLRTGYALRCRECRTGGAPLR